MRAYGSLYRRQGRAGARDHGRRAARVLDRPDGIQTAGAEQHLTSGRHTAADESGVAALDDHGD